MSKQDDQSNDSRKSVKVDPELAKVIHAYCKVAGIHFDKVTNMLIKQSIPELTPAEEINIFRTPARRTTAPTPPRTT